jgi:tagatose-6-phosphate ketose/aldose isomerase
MPLLRTVFPHVDAIPSTEILMDPESSFPRDAFTLVSFARSGNSPEGNALLSIAERLRPGKARHLVITCNREGELARIAGGLGARALTLLLPEESNDKGLAMTASFTSLTIAGYSLAHLGAPEEYRGIVSGLAEAAARLLARGSDLAQALAREDFSRMFFLGTRPFFGGAMEAQLKVQELSGGRILTKAEDTLGFRHGFMAAVDGESLVVLFLSRDPYRRRYEIDLLEELKAKRLGRKTLVVADRARGPDNQTLAGLADHSLEYGPISTLADPFLAPLAAMTGQLIGLFCSLRQGLRPDTPSPSGVINRVVQGVRIHPYGAGG